MMARSNTARTKNGHPVDTRTASRSRGLLSKLRHWAGRYGTSRFAQSVQHVWVVRERPSATVDYLVDPALLEFDVPVEYFSLEDVPAESSVPEGTLVVVVRYLSPNWLLLLEHKRAALAGIVYFMDDDLLDPTTWSGLPDSYVKKLSRLAGKYIPWIRACCSEIWVSTQVLATKYADLSPRLVDWQPLPELLDQRDAVTMCYHGSSSHTDEQVWLKNVVGLALEACPEIHFEIIGDISVNRLFRNFPRVSILHPMSWPNYLAYASATRRNIGLAPLLPGRFNAARGPTKFFDLARMGAVGLYSNVAPYAGFIRDQEDGLLLPNQPNAWVDAIRELVNDRERMARIARMARSRALTPRVVDAKDKEQREL